MLFEITYRTADQTTCLLTNLLNVTRWAWSIWAATGDPVANRVTRFRPMALCSISIFFVLYTQFKWKTQINRFIVELSSSDITTTLHPVVKTKHPPGEVIISADSVLWHEQLYLSKSNAVFDEVNWKKDNERNVVLSRKIVWEYISSDECLRKGMRNACDDVFLPVVDVDRTYFTCKRQCSLWRL